MASAAVQTMRQVLKTMMAGPGFDNVVNKLSVIGGGKGHCICQMTVEERHQNRGGTLHGGATALLVDLVSTTALLTTERAAPGVSVDLSVSYLKPVKVGEDIIIEAKTLKAGQRLAFLSVDVTRKSDGVLLAHGKHTKYVS